MSSGRAGIPRNILMQLATSHSFSMQVILENISGGEVNTGAG
jgi:hypothetical protein